MAPRHRWTLICAHRQRVVRVQVFQRPSIDQCTARVLDKESSCLPLDDAVLPRFEQAIRSPHVDVAQRRRGRSGRTPCCSHTADSHKTSQNPVCRLNRICQRKILKSSGPYNGRLRTFRITVTEGARHTKTNFELCRKFNRIVLEN